MSKTENEDNFYADSNHDNDNDNNNNSNKAPIAVTPKGGALASVSLEALKVALNGVSAMSRNRSGLPTMLFKARIGDGGTFMFGPKQTVPEKGSRWAFDPTSAERGYVSFGDGNKKVGERTLPVGQPMLDPATLPDTGFPWGEQWAINMKCLDGSDRGVEATFKTTTQGGIEAVRDFLIGAICDRLNGDQHDDKIVPIALLETIGYKNEYGPQRKPVFNIIDWMRLDGPAPTPVAPPPPASPPPTEQPRQRQRRVV